MPWQSSFEDASKSSKFNIQTLKKELLTACKSPCIQRLRDTQWDCPIGCVHRAMPDTGFSQPWTRLLGISAQVTQGWELVCWGRGFGFRSSVRVRLTRSQKPNEKWPNSVLADFHARSRSKHSYGAIKRLCGRGYFTVAAVTALTLLGQV